MLWGRTPPIVDEELLIVIDRIEGVWRQSRHLAVRLRAIELRRPSLRFTRLRFVLVFLRWTKLSFRERKQLGEAGERDGDPVGAVVDLVPQFVESLLDDEQVEQ
jgi:hypothetical protein